MSHYAGDMIPPEAVMKLRQKNPGTVSDPLMNLLDNYVLKFITNLLGQDS